MVAVPLGQTHQEGCVGPALLEKQQQVQLVPALPWAPPQHSHQHFLLPVKFELSLCILYLRIL